MHAVDHLRRDPGYSIVRGNLRRVCVPGGADNHHAVEGAAMTVVDYNLPIKIGFTCTLMVLISFLMSLIFYYGKRRDE